MFYNKFNNIYIYQLNLLQIKIFYKLYKIKLNII